MTGSASGKRDQQCILANPGDPNPNFCPHRPIRIYRSVDDGSNNMDFERFFDDAIDLVCCMTPDGQILRLNKRWSLNLGWSEAELLARPIYDFLHPDDSQMCLREMLGIRDGGEIVAFENRLMKKDGGFLWVQWNLSPMGENLLSVTARDISEIVTARESMIAQQKTLEIGAEMANFGAWRMDLDSGELHWSPTTYNLYGQDVDGFVPTVESVVGLYHPGDQESIAKWFGQIKESSETVSGKSRILTPDGQVRFMMSQTSIQTDVMADGRRFVFGVTQDLTEHELTLMNVQHAVLHDPLTGLANRTMFSDRLKTALALSRRNQSLIAVLLLDLTRFKAINDAYGHPVGDRVLIDVANRLSSVCRESDTIARLGSDEFAIICTGGDSAEDVQAMANRLLKAFQKPLVHESKELKINACIGISLAPTDTNDDQKLLLNADLALYKSKRIGAGSYCFYEHGMDARLARKRSLSRELESGIQDAQLEVHYQPVLDVKSHSVKSMEALVRWRHPERGLISPNEFIPIAEETGLIVDLGSWVMSRACEDAAALPESVKVAVNVSALEFRNHSLINNIERSLSNANIAPDRLEIEITETALLNQYVDSVKMLNQLREMGVNIVLDDFGVGYSSLSYLRSFPFNKIKLDRSFVFESVSHSADRAIIRAVSSMASALGIETTAEGVETKDHLGIIESEGYTQVQGYLFSRPRPLIEITRDYFPDKASPLSELRKAV